MIPPGIRRRCRLRLRRAARAWTSWTLTALLRLRRRAEQVQPISRHRREESKGHTGDVDRIETGEGSVDYFNGACHQATRGTFRSHGSASSPPPAADMSGGEIGYRTGARHASLFLVEQSHSGAATITGLPWLSSAVRLPADRLTRAPVGLADSAYLSRQSPFSGANSVSAARLESHWVTPLSPHYATGGHERTTSNSTRKIVPQRLLFVESATLAIPSCTRVRVLGVQDTVRVVE